MMRRLFFLPLLLAPVLLILGCTQPPPDKPVRPVKAVRVGDISDLGKRWFPGRARAAQEVNLSFQVSGPLIAFPVRVGDVVTKGQLLAQIDPRDFDVKVLSAESVLKQSQANLQAMRTGARPEEIAQLEAGLRKAQADYETANTEYLREQKLYSQNVVSALDFDRSVRRRESALAALDHAKESLRIGKEGSRKEDLKAKEAEIKSLEAALEDAKNRLDDTYLRAPFGGEIAATYVENFQNVQAKEPILRLLDTTHILLSVDVPETLIYLAPQVKAAAVRFNAFPGREFPATVREIGAEASRATGTYPVTLTLTQPGDVRILPGMSGEAQARATTAPHTDEQIVAPLTAVFSAQESGANASFVWVVDPERKTVSQRLVTIGEITTLGVKVVKGLKSGEWVVAAGVHHLEEGQRVEFQK